MVKRVGVLALQGAYQKHADMLTTLLALPVLVRTAQDCENLDGLIIPGGESTTMGLLLERFALTAAICQLHEAKKPIFGTCAGMILLAKIIEGSDQFRLGFMDLAIARNAYGRQIDSFSQAVDIPCLGVSAFPAVFIRAPKISQLLALDVEVLASYQNEPILVRQAHLLAAAFHPELSDDIRLHNYFLQLVAKRVDKGKK